VELAVLKKRSETATPLAEAIPKEIFAGVVEAEQDCISAYNIDTPMVGSIRPHSQRMACWRAFKTDHLCALNFDQAFLHRI